MSDRLRPVVVQQPEECRECGALVLDWFRHQQWHSNFDVEVIRVDQDELNEKYYELDSKIQDWTEQIRRLTQARDDRRSA